MAVNKVIYAGRTLIDISDSTVTKNTLAEGVVAYSANGERIVGTLNILESTYPVGSIYMSVKNVSPATLFGGTWTAWGTGRVPVGIDTSQTEFSTVEKTGGAKTHTLTVDQIPSHSHSESITKTVDNLVGTVGTSGTRAAVKGTDTETSSPTTGTKGGGAAHNNLQPYITCYMWKRTA